MKKLLLNIKDAIAEHGAENVDFDTVVHLELNGNTGEHYVIVDSEVHPAGCLGCIEAELLITQSSEGPQFDEAAAREWLEGLSLNLPPEDEEPATVLHVSGDMTKEDLDTLKEAVVDAGPAFTNAKHVGNIVTSGDAFNEHVEDLKAAGLPVATSNAEFEALVSPIGSSMEKLDPGEEDVIDPISPGGTMLGTEQLAEKLLEAEAEKIREVINNVRRGQHIRTRRLNALEAAGYSVSGSVLIKNFGKSGTVKVHGSKVFAQLEANVNYTDCYVYEISK